MLPKRNGNSDCNGVLPAKYASAVVAKSDCNGVLPAKYASAVVAQSHACGSNQSISDLTEGPYTTHKDLRLETR